jgi:tyrosine-protein kinase Etk/Wzc
MMRESINDISINNYQEEEDINIREILWRYVRYWYVFVTVIAFSLFCSYIYNRYSEKVYLVKSKVLVQDEKKTPQEQKYSRS